MKEYFLGLDIGTNSVGWAVTDLQYQILKKNGKALWGVRLFDEAQKAKDWRSHRTSRRRLERRNQRIEWIRMFFSEEIAKVDPAFFLRMDESKFLQQDKKLTEDGRPLGKYTLFADADYNDADYHRDFPTIYHLREALMKEDRTFDVRLVYLAVHHIMKKRGHFLFADVNLEDVSFESCMQDLRDYLREEHELFFTLADEEAFRQALTDRSLNITRKKAALRKAAGVDRHDEQLCAIIDLLAGAKVKVSAVCAMELPKDQDISFSFKEGLSKTNEENESVEERLLKILDDEKIKLIHLLNRIYDWALLYELRKGATYISCAKVKTYEEHHADLAQLKQLFRTDKKLFQEVFLEAGDKDNYPAYSGHGAANHRCDNAAFCTYLRKQIKALMPKLNEEQQSEAQQILEKMDAGSFLNKQTSKDNGVIPHQLHQQELEIILERASAYLPFLNARDESGLSVREKIMALFTFRVPYYVGPLNASSWHSWVARGEEKITPWNFEKVVDINQSAENFITRMTATCSYLGEHVLPKDSLLYSRFVALNMINKLQINGHPISVELKQRIFKEHLVSRGRSNFKVLQEYLLSNGLMEKGDELGGVDAQFKLRLTGYRVFHRLLEDEGNTPMVEDIIRHVVIYEKDCKQLKCWLQDTYGDRLSAEDQAYVLCNRGQFSGWGNLSEAFLQHIEHTDPQTGELFSIMDMLWQSNYNLSELLSSEFEFAQNVEKFRQEKYYSKKCKLDEVLKESYASPGIRRSIRQTIAIISEIEKIMGGAPKRVFVEVARSEGVKERIPSRKHRLEELYAACKEEVYAAYKDKEQASNVYKLLQSCDEAKLRSAKLYLYFTQMGKCMYSGEPIDLERLNSDYDIDHIHPQSVVKDDSLDNRVLVKRQLNAQKSDQYPLPEAWRMNMRAFWRELRDKKFISEEKYRRLTRNTSFGEQERSDFIARQIVETSQSCKIVAELLRARYEGADRVVYVKAGNVSSFRQDQRILPDGSRAQAWKCKNLQTQQDPLFVKCREVNDFHHAKDAYLNIVVGNVYHVKFTCDPKKFVQSKQTYSMNRMFDFDVVRGDECAWRSGENGSIATVRRMMGKNNILFTRYVREGRGGLFKQTIQAKNASRGKSPRAMIKSSDARMRIEDYGSYSELSTAYFMLVEHMKPKKRVRSIETVLLIDKALYERDPETYRREKGLLDARVLIPRIQINSVICHNGARMYISGRSGDQILYKNANQLIIPLKDMQYVKRISKYLERTAKDQAEPNPFDQITATENEALYSLLLKKLTEVQCFAEEYKGAIIKAVSSGMDAFIHLSIREQCKALQQILGLFNTNGGKVNLKAIGWRDGAPKICITKNLGEKDTYKLVHQSVTGVFEQEIDLWGDAF